MSELFRSALYRLCFELCRSRYQPRVVVRTGQFAIVRAMS